MTQKCAFALQQNICHQSWRKHRWVAHDDMNHGQIGENGENAVVIQAKAQRIFPKFPSLEIVGGAYFKMRNLSLSWK